MAREASSTSTRYILAALFVTALKYKCLLSIKKRMDKLFWSVHAMGYFTKMKMNNIK